MWLPLVHYNRQSHSDHHLLNFINVFHVKSSVNIFSVYATPQTFSSFLHSFTRHIEDIIAHWLHCFPTDISCTSNLCRNPSFLSRILFFIDCTSMYIPYSWSYFPRGRETSPGTEGLPTKYLDHSNLTIRQCLVWLILYSCQGQPPSQFWELFFLEANHIPS